MAVVAAADVDRLLLRRQALLPLLRLPVELHIPALQQVRMLSVIAAFKSVFKIPEDPCLRPTGAAERTACAAAS